MKGKMVAAIAVGLVTQVSAPSVVFAKQHHQGPCRAIVEACRKAGFEKGAKSKRLFRDCVDKIVNQSEAVEGVQVSQEDITACQEIKKIRQKGN